MYNKPVTFPQVVCSMYMRPGDIAYPGEEDTLIDVDGTEIKGDFLITQKDYYSDSGHVLLRGIEIMQDSESHFLARLTHLALEPQETLEVEMYTQQDSTKFVDVLGGCFEQSFAERYYKAKKEGENKSIEAISDMIDELEMLKEVLSMEPTYTFFTEKTIRDQVLSRIKLLDSRSDSSSDSSNEGENV